MSDTESTSQSDTHASEQQQQPVLDTPPLEVVGGMHGLPPGRRFVPVPAVDGSLVERWSQRSMQLVVASAAQTNTIVFAHELYPITPHFNVDVIDARVWSPHTSHAEVHAFWKSAYGTLYEPIETSAESYRRDVLNGEDGMLGLFGLRHNPLDDVIALCHRLQNTPKSHELFLHFTAAVCLQFYLSVCGAFMRIRTDDASFNESFPPTIALLFCIDDCGDSTSSSERGELTAETLPEFARTLSFESFLHCVLVYIYANHPCVQSLFVSDREIHEWCYNKARRNLLQMLTCMRFISAFPSNLVERIQESMRARPGKTNTCIPTAGDVKFFPHPTNISMRQVKWKRRNAISSKKRTHAEMSAVLDPSKADAQQQQQKRNMNRAKHRVPYCLTHMLFGPSSALVRRVEQPNALCVERALLWQLAAYFPLSDFSVHIKAEMEKVWERRMHVFPETLHEKEKVYDPILSMNPIRGRYSFYVHNEQAFVLIPQLMLRANIVHDERDVLHMTPRVWEWCARMGRSLDLNELYAMLHERTNHLRACEYHMIKRSLHAARSSHPHINHFQLYTAVYVLTRSEEDAVATISPHGHEVDLHACQNGSRIATNSIMNYVRARPDIRALLGNTVREWDMCTHVEPPRVRTPYDSSLALIWTRLFPTPAISHAGEAWTKYRHVPTTIPVIKKIVDRAMGQMRTTSVDAEIKLLHSRPLSDEERRYLEIYSSLTPQAHMRTSILQLLAHTHSESTTQA
jgi:hypothetical protein